MLHDPSTCLVRDIPLILIALLAATGFTASGVSPQEVHDPTYRTAEAFHCEMVTVSLRELRPERIL
jgi:hypothetical protein